MTENFHRVHVSSNFFDMSRCKIHAGRAMWNPRERLPLILSNLILSNLLQGLLNSI